jgi:hypothetical protein
MLTWKKLRDDLTMDIEMSRPEHIDKTRKIGVMASTIVTAHECSVPFIGNIYGSAQLP